MLGNKTISNKELEQLVEKCIQDLSEDVAHECRLGRRYRAIRHGVGIVTAGGIGWFLGFGHSILSDLPRLEYFPENYLLDKTLWGRFADVAKFAIYTQPEAIVCAFATGFIAHKILEKDYMNYNKKILGEYFTF